MADFDIQGLAAYLHLTPSQVGKLVDRGELPGRKVGGSWKFSEQEIHHWLEERIGVFEEGQLTHVETVLEKSAPSVDEQPVTLSEIIPAEGVACPLAAKTRSRVVDAMVELAVGTGRLWDADKMAEAVRAREAMQPTATESGFALLHPRRPMPNILSEPLVVVGTTPSGIPFGGRGGVLTDIFFLIGSVDDREHLRTLARLARVLQGPQMVDRIRQAESASELRDLLLERDAEIE